MGEQSEQKPVLHFIDAAGRIWHPHVDCRVVDEFERHVEMGVFQAIFEVLLSAKGKKQKDKNNGERIVLDLAGRLFGRIGSLTFLLYEACRPRNNPEGKPIAHYQDPDKLGCIEGAEVEYADFRAGIGKEQISAALVVAVNALFDFFPEVGKASGGGGSSSPLDRSPGEMSMNVRP